jgi:hypothetical protein
VSQLEGASLAGGLGHNLTGKGTLATGIADATIRLLCPYKAEHTLGAVLRMFDPTGEVWPAGLQPNGIHWSDGAGNLVQQSWGTTGGQILVRANGTNQPPISIEGHCKRCTRERGAAASARPGRKWAEVVKWLDMAIAADMRDLARKMPTN